MNSAVGVVLAAGKGTRMYSDLAKVLHPICGRPMLAYPLAVLQELGLARVFVVVGHQAERIREEFADAPVEWVIQAEQLGTAHAVRCALPRLAGFEGSVLICCGDTPLLTAATLNRFLEGHGKAGADLSVLSMVLEQPGAYGRILRNFQGKVVGIIEAKDAGRDQLDIREVNTGIYCAAAGLLRAVIPLIGNDNAQGEYYLTDMLQKSSEQGWKVEAMAAAAPEEVLGVNTGEELARAARIIGQRRLDAQGGSESCGR
jgi:bifunctional UDP-N-acetylglucosamine pyrophosphorylase/glucosamine-1-phosphate N-acetyltransferase